MKKGLANEKIMKFFSSLSDKTRLEIILSIAENPKTVNQIYEKVGKGKMTLSAISHQLKLLNSLEIVSYERSGKEKIFRLSDKYCWCILREAFSQFGNKLNIKCKKCGKETKK